MNQKTEDIPFDTKHFQHIVYGGKITELKSNLVKALRFFIRKHKLESQGSTRQVPQLSETFRKAGLVPSQSVATHVSRLANFDASPISAVDGAILLWNTPSFKLFGREGIWMANRDDHLMPSVFQSAPRISELSTHRIETHQNRPKYFISNIQYPESDITDGRLQIELGHSNYRMNTQLSEALNRSIDDQGLTLREWYEKGKLSYRYDLPNMVVIKPVVISAAAHGKPRQMLFVKRPEKTDFYPNHWTVGIDEQMQGTPISPDEGGFDDPKFRPDIDFFSAAQRGLKEELGILETDIESIGLIALFREYENYNVNALFVCHLSVDSSTLHNRLIHAPDSIEARQHEWRDATTEELVPLLARKNYIPKDTRLLSGDWHPDSRLRLLSACFNLFGVEQILSKLEAATG